MCLKQSFFDSKWVLQVILSLSVLSNCVSDHSNFDTAFSNFIVFFQVSRFNKDPKNVPQTGTIVL